MPRHGLSVETASRDHLWLCLVGVGHSVKAIARRDHKSIRTVQLGIKRARGLAAARAAATLFGPPLVLFFPINVFSPGYACRCTPTNHRPGSVLTCAACHRSGCDGHPALTRHKSTDPAPDPKAPNHGTTTPPPTRRERRRRRGRGAAGGQPA